MSGSAAGRPDPDRTGRPVGGIPAAIGTKAVITPKTVIGPKTVISAKTVIMPMRTIAVRSR
ncbi:MAG TPA: hypothetical protein VN408_13395 [Actinoplanes sp.]|nr:hypothetical protein [Actinoplanes sp.]